MSFKNTVSWLYGLIVDKYVIDMLFEIDITL